MSWFSHVQSLITFRKPSSSELIVPELDSQGRIRVSIEYQEDIRKLQNFIDEGPVEGYPSGSYKETLPFNSPFPSSSTWYTSVDKSKKIVELNITRNEQMSILTSEWKMYNDNNQVLLTVTDTYEYTNGIFEIGRVRIIS